MLVFVQGRDEDYCHDWTKASPNLATLSVDTESKLFTPRRCSTGRQRHDLSMISKVACWNNYRREVANYWMLVLVMLMTVVHILNLQVVGLIVYCNPESDCSDSLGDKNYCSSKDCKGLERRINYCETSDCKGHKKKSYCALICVKRNWKHELLQQRRLQRDCEKGKKLLFI